MENKNTTPVNYTKAKEAFDLAQLMVNRFKAKGFNYPPVLALAKELRLVRCQKFIYRRRKEQLIYRYHTGLKCKNQKNELSEV